MKNHQSKIEWGNTVSYKILKSANGYISIVQNGLTQLVLNFLDFNKQPRIGIDQIIRKNFACFFYCNILPYWSIVIGGGTEGSNFDRDTTMK